MFQRKMTPTSPLGINNATRFDRSDIQAICDIILQCSRTAAAPSDCKRDLLTPSQSCSAEGFNQVTLLPVVVMATFVNHRSGFLHQNLFNYVKFQF